jgi:hypothetical protein
MYSCKDELDHSEKFANFYRFICQKDISGSGSVTSIIISAPDPTWNTLGEKLRRVFLILNILCIKTSKSVQYGIQYTVK